MNPTILVCMAVALSIVGVLTVVMRNRRVRNRQHRQ